MRILQKCSLGIKQQIKSYLIVECYCLIFRHKTIMLRRSLMSVIKQQNKISNNISLRAFSQTKLQLCRNKNEEDDRMKNDPDVKQYLKELHSDFDNKVKKATDSKESKNVQQLLSELYGETDTATEKENFSSVGKTEEICLSNGFLTL